MSGVGTEGRKQRDVPSEAVSRRELLRRVGLGSLALAAVPALARVTSEPAYANGDQWNWFFIGVGEFMGGDFDGDLVIINGSGGANEHRVVGHGSLTHFDPTGAPPFPVVGSGTWKAKRLSGEGLDIIGTYGAHAAGHLEFEANAVLSDGTVMPISLHVHCNIPPGGLFTGEAEGVILTTPLGVAEPVAGLFLTTFTSGVEQRD